MDAGGRCSERFQVSEYSRGTESVFLCATTPEFLSPGGLEYPNPVDPGDNGGSAGPRGARSRRQSCAVRGDHSAGTGRSLDIAAAGGGNFGRDLGWFGAAARCHRTVWRDVVRGVAEHPRTGAAHGAWRRRLQSVAAGDVAWLGVDGRRCGPWRGGGALAYAGRLEALFESGAGRTSWVRGGGRWGGDARRWS